MMIHPKDSAAQHGAGETASRNSMFYTAAKILAGLLFLLLLTGCGQTVLMPENSEQISAVTTEKAETPTSFQTETAQRADRNLPDGPPQTDPPQTDPPYPTLSGFTLSAPAEVDLVPDRVRRFLRADPETRDVHEYRSQSDIPRPVILKWHTEEETDGSFQVLVSETEDFSSAWIYETEESEISVFNLKTDCDYYWTVLATFNSGTYMAETGFFHTLPGPRFLQVDGDKTGNFRDVGGYRTCFGVSVKEGMAYRGTEVNGLHNISETGRYLLTEILGIKADLDLRSGKESGDLSESPLGSQVIYLPISSASYSSFLTSGQSAKIFAELAKAENYPLYFHCVWGADRTGSLAAVLLALLGIEEEDILVDFELTSFCGSGERNRRSKDFALFWDALHHYEGDTLHEKAETLVIKEYDLTIQQISNIRSLFLYSGVTFGSQSFSARSARPGRSIYLYLNDFSEITAADIDGIPADFKADKEGVSIQLPDSLSPGEVTGHLEADGTPLFFSVIVRGN